MNSVNFENGKKLRIGLYQMLKYKERSNLGWCRYGLSVTEVKTKKRARWKDELIETLYDALENTSLKDEFIEYMELHGYKVK